jgi:hypothetical protein
MGIVMVTKRQRPAKKYFTATEANAMLPLVRAVVKDIVDLARDLRDRHERLTRIAHAEQMAPTEAHHEELLLIESELEKGQNRLREYENELKALGVELKDYFTGLIDFPCWMNDHEVYLCWRMGEPEVTHWHEIEDGFAGRQKLFADAGRI